jgi:Protein of unknown function (DUF4238)
MRPPIAALESWTDLNAHVTPQFYLREFRDPMVPDAGGPSIWVADLRERKVELRAVKSVGANVSCSVPEGPGSPDEVTGEGLAKIESGTVQVVRKLLSGDLELTEQQRAGLLSFAAFLVTHVATFRSDVEETAGDIVRSVMKVDPGGEDFEERTHETIRPDLTSEEVEDARRMAFDRRTRAREGSTVISLATRIEHASKTVYPILDRMHWTILTPPGDRHFITSDRPVSWLDATAPAMFDLGLTARNVEVLFAVGPTVGLLGRWHGSVGPVQMGSEVVDRANRRQVMFADRYVFADDREAARHAIEIRCRLEGRR